MLKINPLEVKLDCLNMGGREEHLVYMHRNGYEFLVVYDLNCIFFCFFFVCFFVFLGPHPRHVEVPRLGV